MGKGDHCAVFGCQNDRRFPEKLVVKEHVREIKWHSCPPKWRALWTRIINRKVFTVTSNTKICSNHFMFGKPTSSHPHPCMYMKGYDAKPDQSHIDNLHIQNLISSLSAEKDTQDTSTNYIRTRQGQIKRKMEPEQREKPQKCRSQESLADHFYCSPSSSATGGWPDAGSEESQETTNWYTSSTYSTACLTEEHSYASLSASADQTFDTVCTCVKCDICKKHVQKLEEENETFQREIQKMEQMLKECNQPCDMLKKTYSIESLKESDQLILLHTGLPSYKLFLWVYNTVQSKLPYMQYYRGANSETVKSYQQSKVNKPGPRRLLTHENELLITLMKLKLNLPVQFLAHLFGASTSLISQVLSTWLPLLSYELKPLLYWPAQEEISLYYPTCFKKFCNVRAIIDCTEVPIQRPSLAKANTQIFSSYKGRPTVKILVACTPAGTISFVSKATGGSMSDKELVKKSGIIDLFDPGDSVLADKGFNIQELLLQRSVKLIIPPFLKAKQQFCDADDTRTKQVANARIHVERVIGRMKDFDIMKSELPLDMFDVFDHIVTIVAALVNLQPPIVPLKCN